MPPEMFSAQKFELFGRDDQSNSEILFKKRSGHKKSLAKSGAFSKTKD